MLCNSLATGGEGCVGTGWAPTQSLWLCNVLNPLCCTRVTKLLYAQKIPTEAKVLFLWMLDPSLPTRAWTHITLILSYWPGSRCRFVKVCSCQPTGRERTPLWSNVKSQGQSLLLGLLFYFWRALDKQPLLISPCEWAALTQIRDSSQLGLWKQPGHCLLLRYVAGKVTGQSLANETHCGLFTTSFSLEKIQKNLFIMKYSTVDFKSAPIDCYSIDL